MLKGYINPLKHLVGKISKPSSSGGDKGNTPAAIVIIFEGVVSGIAGNAEIQEEE